MEDDDITENGEYQEHVVDKSYAKGDKAYERGQKNSKKVKSNEIMDDTGREAQARRANMKLVKNAGRASRERRGYKDEEKDDEKDGEKDEKDEKKAT
ncbi:hypothetical protein CPAR01_13278 [Colletotrichum paranaense]|uniref:Uncharacterized protein n=1 Tax=Colletotrichum paranaense TaxID=1914294 RepID=A0ABQ9S695_9PEZI|nr:uncharacterized protein CPAR01_13278 [Colletotrichum paranaense]KAK1526750.1 hypothetical protein CPAR01_13278 [Colletotrichum paranaense]